MKLAKIAGALPFAQLLGLPSTAAAKAADEDDQKKKDDEARRAEDDKQREGESDDDYAKRMKKAEDDKQREGESDEDYAKRMKKAETDDEDDEGAEDDSDDAKAARASERARCAAIVAHGIKTGAVRQAGVFAFDTALSAKQAIALMDASGLDGGKRNGLAQRMAATVVPHIGADGGNVNTDRTSAKAVAAQIIAAGQKRRNEV